MFKLHVRKHFFESSEFIVIFLFRLAPVFNIFRKKLTKSMWPCHADCVLAVMLMLMTFLVISLSFRIQHQSGAVPQRHAECEGAWR